MEQDINTGIDIMRRGKDIVHADIMADEDADLHINIIIGEKDIGAHAGTGQDIEKVAEISSLPTGIGRGILPS